MLRPAWHTTAVRFNSRQSRLAASHGYDMLDADNKRAVLPVT